MPYGTCPIKHSVICKHSTYHNCSTRFVGEALLTVCPPPPPITEWYIAVAMPHLKYPNTCLDLKMNKVLKYRLTALLEMLAFWLRVKCEL